MPLNADEFCNSILDVFSPLTPEQFNAETSGLPEQMTMTVAIAQMEVHLQNILHRAILGTRFKKLTLSPLRELVSGVWLHGAEAMIDAFDRGGFQVSSEFKNKLH